MKNAYSILIGNSKGKRPHGKYRHRWESDMELHLNEIVRGCIQKFPDRPPGMITAKGTALCH